MGNRCVITDEARTISVYLHWNGGIGSVEGFLTYCGMKGCRGFGEDTSYAAARLIQVVGNFFGGYLSLGVSPYSTDEAEDPGDNGIYVVRGWKIVKHLVRENWDKPGLDEKDIEHEKREYPLDEMLRAIDEAQPENERLGDYLTAEEADARSLRIGDSFYRMGTGGIEAIEVMGYGEGIVNGRDVTGLPFGFPPSWSDYYEMRGKKPDPEELRHNPNCYPDSEKVKAIRRS